MRGMATAAALALTATAFALSAVPALANESGTVDAQVAVAAPCITLDKTSVDFGTAAFTTGSGAGANIKPPHPWPAFTNCSQSAEYVAMRGTSATGAGASWSLNGLAGNPCTPGINVYAADLTGYDGTGYQGSGGYPVARSQYGSGGLKTQNKLFYDPGPAPNKPLLFTAGQRTSLGIDLWMPCSGSDGAGQTMTFDIVLTASF
jgi:hypothetical protein